MVKRFLAIASIILVISSIFILPASAVGLRQRPPAYVDLTSSTQTVQYFVTSPRFASAWQLDTSGGVYVTRSYVYTADFGLLQYSAPGYLRVDPSGTHLFFHTISNTDPSFDGTVLWSVSGSELFTFQAFRVYFDDDLDRFSCKDASGVVRFSSSSLAEVQAYYQEYSGKSDHTINCITFNGNINDSLGHVPLASVLDYYFPLNQYVQTNAPDVVQMNLLDAGTDATNGMLTVFKNFMNFELFGFNLQNTVFALFTLALVIALVVFVVRRLK